MLTSIDWAAISGFILTWGAIAGAIAGICKLIAPFTKVGKKAIEKKRKKREESLQENIKAVSGAVLAPFRDDINGIKTQIDNMTILNANQSKQLELLEERINEDEVDRIRQEILSFSYKCHKKEEAQLEEYSHIFTIHDKYLQLLQKLGRENGQIDIEFEFIKQYYISQSQSGDN